MDDLNAKNFKELLVKKPFYEITPRGYLKHGTPVKMMNDNMVMPNDYLWKTVKTQADFLREYYPSAHRIFDQQEYPDIIKRNPEFNPEDPENPANGHQFYIQPISRTAFAFQQVIATKHILHLTGNDVQFELADCERGAKERQSQNMLNTFRKGWLTSDMEVVHFQAVRSLMIVAEAAVVGYFDKGRFAAKTLSYINGDMLFPQFDTVNGQLTLFARKYFDFDENGNRRIEWVEVWDSDTLRRYKRNVEANKVIEKVKDLFGLRGYSLVSEQKHGFDFIPVAYVRNDDGPCWASVQRNIEDYEEAFSYLTEANKNYAFPIFYIKGDGDEVTLQGDMNGAVKAVAMNNKDNDAGFLNGTDASSAFATQLNKAYDLIYELSFTVKPPELKSGDLPGVALKLLYSPAIEVAMNDAQAMQPFLNQLVRIAKYGIGYENNVTATMMQMPINAWVEPYIHQNDAELVTNLATAVQNHFLSKQTASERNSKYSKNDEYERIIREQKEEDQQDLLMQIQQMEAQTENDIQQKKEEARINSDSQSGQDINTAHGKAGRPNRSGTEWDENGNWPGRNNWDKNLKK